MALMTMTSTDKHEHSESRSATDNVLLASSNKDNPRQRQDQHPLDIKGRSHAIDSHRQDEHEQSSSASSLIPNPTVLKPYLQHRPIMANTHYHSPFAIHTLCAS